MTTKTDYIANLNSQKFPPSESQLEAIINTEGPLLIIAGPGAGKTRLGRILYTFVVMLTYQ